MAHISPGVAYELWRRVQERAADLGLNGVQLAERVGLRRATIDALRSSTRPPQPRIIDALADHLGIDRREAYVLAGRLPPEQAPVDSGNVRMAIEISDYTDAQRRVLLETLDIFDQVNAAKRADPP